MTVLAEDTAAAAPAGVLVSAPSLKFAIGFTSTICAVLLPRLLAALATPDNATITFVTRPYMELALLLSALVGIVVSILEWRVPRAPRDTFMMTLGLPAILAGALSVHENTASLQDAVKTQEALATTLATQAGIAIEPAKPAAEEPHKQGALMDLLVTPVYAQSATPVRLAAQQSRPLGIVIDQPRYAIVLDRAPTQQAAQAKAAQLNQQLKRAAPSRPLTVEVQPQGSEFLVVAPGGARTKSDAILDAVRLKETYRLNPALIEVAKKS